jgi:hypothetical protein
MVVVRREVTRVVRSFSAELGNGVYIKKYAWKISTQFGKEAAKFTGIQVKNVINRELHQQICLENFYTIWKGTCKIYCDRV